MTAKLKGILTLLTSNFDLVKMVNVNKCSEYFQTIFLLTQSYLRLSRLHEIQLHWVSITHKVSALFFSLKV